MNKINKFMQGRYGIDELYKFLLYFICTLIIINIFINSFMIGILQLIIFVIMIYRSLSKKIYKRIKENNYYLNKKRKIKLLFTNKK